MKLDAFISTLRSILLKYGNVDVYTLDRDYYVSKVEHDDIMILNPSGDIVISKVHFAFNVNNVKDM